MHDQGGAAREPFHEVVDERQHLNRIGSVQVGDRPPHRVDARRTVEPGDVRRIARIELVSFDEAHHGRRPADLLEQPLPVGRDRVLAAQPECTGHMFGQLDLVDTAIHLPAAEPRQPLHQPSTAATAALSSAWTRTFSARSVTTRVTDGPGRSMRLAQLGGAGDGDRGNVVGAGERLDVGSVGGTEQLLEPGGGKLGGLGQEREDPAAVVVGDDDPQVDVAFGESHQGVRVVHEGDVADPHDRRPTGQRSAERRRHDTVDPVGPAVGMRACPSLRRTTRGREPASTRRRPTRRRRATSSANVRARHPARSARPVAGIRRSRRRHAASACRHRAIHGVSGGALERREVVEAAEPGDVVIRVDHTWPADLKDGSARTPRPTARAPSRRADDRTARRSQARVPGRTRDGASIESKVETASSPARHPDCGSASIGQPSRAASVSIANGSTPWRPPTMITPALTVELGRHGPAHGDAAWHRQRRADRLGQLADLAQQRLAERQVEMDRPGARRWRTRAGRVAATTPDRTRRAPARRGTSAPSGRTARSGRSSAARRRRAAPAAGRR